MDGGNEYGRVVLEVRGAEARDFLQEFALGGLRRECPVNCTDGPNNAFVAKLLELRVGGFGDAISEEEQAVVRSKLNGEILVLPIRQDAQDGTVAAE